MLNEILYAELSKLRELFHKYGRFDDSNAKLDEISKYIAIYVYQIQHSINKKDNLKNLMLSYEDDNTIDLVSKLKTIFSDISLASEFINHENISIFGSYPSLNIEKDDNVFAYHLIKLVVNTIDHALNSTNSKFNYDLLNETFGHFVRDNFRNHIEDAQYMTPNEVVNLMCDIALCDIKNDISRSFNNQYLVCDPCCGVGSFLSSFFRKNKLSKIINPDNLNIIGQDKVSRMVRLSKINMFLLGNHNHVVFNGNSLVGDSLLDNYAGQIDLIITNPPFGAKFSSEELKPMAKTKYPLLYDIISKNGSVFNSEILFIDRCISLLKPGGRFLAVLPDSVISSAGLNSILRHRLITTKSISIKSIIELPAVTFAQAGTRTKTSILYLQKEAKQSTSNNVFIAQSKSIGFDVSTKKGATIKVQTGENDLLKIYEIYKDTNNMTNIVDHETFCDLPSCVIINKNILINDSWTPNHYNAKKYQTIKILSNKSEIELVELKDIVNFDTLNRKKELISNDSKCISILHILNDDNLNFEEMINYKPKTPGIKCKPGDLLFSKINPRILRVLVVPELNFDLTCSPEFEIMNSIIDINNYGIKLLLMLPSVQVQINYLTSGTSSSHNRIKSQDLSKIRIPLPKKNTTLHNKLKTIIGDYEKRNMQLNILRLDMIKNKQSFFDLVS